MHKLETVTGAAAAARYGDRAVNGAVIGSTVTTLLERYKAPRITATNIGSLQMNRRSCWHGGTAVARHHYRVSQSGEQRAA
jgi:hypothetical protein